jgi:hypothetical protein
MTINRFGTPILICLVALVAWGGITNSSNSSSTADGPVWMESEIGLSLGIILSEETKNATSPVLNVYFKNNGSNEVSGVIQSSARFIVELNGEFFATMDRGGKSSFMPPGRMYGPLKVDTSKFWKISKLEAIYTVQPNESHPVIKPGKNTLRLHYKIFSKTGDVLIPTAEIVIMK